MTHLAQESLINIQYSGGSRSFAKEMGALTLRGMVAGHPKTTTTNWEDHQSLSHYNCTRSCWRTHCRPFCGHLAFEANWKDKKAQSWADCKSKKFLVLKCHLLLFYTTTKNYFLIRLWLVGACGESKMETYITTCKIGSQWEFAVWLKEL